MEKYIKRVCKKHGLTDFVYIESDNKYRCRKCLVYDTTNRRRELKSKLVEYKGGKCEICGYDKCIDALEFHHINPEEKKFQISCGVVKNIDVMKKEADKCILVCSNCHQEIHHRIREEEELKRIIKEEENIKNYKKNCEENNQKINSKKTELVLEDVMKDLSTMTQREAAEKNGCSLATLKRFLKENGQTNPHKRKLSIYTVKDFVNLCIKYDFKKSLIRKELNVQVFAIREFCNKNNIPWDKNELIEFCKNYINS